MQFPRNIGGILTAKIGNVPLSNAAGTRNGSAIDRQGFMSAVLVAKCGAATGSPSAQSVDVKLQDSEDGSTGWADLTGAAVATLDADNSIARVAVDLSGAKRYVRAVEVVAFTAGTSPEIPSDSTVILGGADDNPPT